LKKGYINKNNPQHILTGSVENKYIAAVELFRFRSRGGVQFPTGGKELFLSPRAPLRLSFRAIFQGQQIWCESRADGDSPDDRERVRQNLILSYRFLWLSITGMLFFRAYLPVRPP
jgi:hypothetical protein